MNHNALYRLLHNIYITITAILFLYIICMYNCKILIMNPALIVTD